MSKMKQIAFDFMEILSKYDVWNGSDICIYFDNKRISSHNYGGSLDKKKEQTSSGLTYFIEEDMNPKEYFSYANPHTLSCSFEGDLYHILNYGYDSEIEEEIDKLFEDNGFYKEYGDAWNFTLVQD